MNRRDAVLGLLALCAVAGPLGVSAQQPESARRIGVLMGYAESDPEAQLHLGTFKETFAVLVSYGIDNIDLFRRAAPYVDRILRGAKPADLPVQQTSRLELVINTKTAKALGLTLPQSIMVRADRVVE